MYQTSTSAWLEYFERQLTNVDESKRTDEFNRHMKHGPEPFYWPEYIFYSYVNHTSDFIISKGLPDIPESQPCHDQYLPDREW